MKTKKQIYLPKWQRWFIIPMFVSLWLFFTYMEFFNPDNPERIGLVGYIFMSALFLGLAIIMYLMTSGKLPAYTIEQTKEKDE